MIAEQHDMADAKVREESLTTLSSQFDAYIKRLAPELQDASTRLGLMFDIPASETRSGWFGHFSPLALLYPQFQFDDVAEIPSEVMEQASLAHVQLLVHAVIEDRILDGQFQPSGVDVLFSKQLFTDALVTLMGIPNREQHPRDWIQHLLAAYSAAQTHVYEQSNGNAPRADRSAALRSIVCGRGYLGLVATMNLAGVYVGDPRRVWSIRNAFDALMIGMQWADDLRDWQEDLAVGDVNLLLHSLKRTGLDPYQHPDDEVRTANVGHALLQSGALDRAVTHATRWFKIAAIRQREIGSHAMADLIESKTGPLSGWRRAQTEEIEACVRDTALRIAMPKTSD